MSPILSGGIRIVRHTVPLQSGMEPFPGYRLGQLLGYGSFAQVWEARGEDGTNIALKFLPAEGPLATPAEIRSLQAIRQLLHPNLIRIDRVWCHLGYIVIAMERAEGSLLDLQATYRSELGTTIIPEHACLLLSQAAAALDFLNGRKHDLDGKSVTIQHCDIKPSNLMLFGDTVKLADFGLSAQLSGPMIARRACGTPEYSAPEIFHSLLSRHSDQFSLAVTYCELRGGRLPYAQPPRSFQSTYVHPAPDLSMLSPEERPILTRALEPSPEERWPSCVEFLNQVARLFV